MHRTRSNQRHVSVDINISEQPERCLGLQLLEPSTSFDSQVRGWNNDLEACFSERNARSSAGYQQHPTGKCIAHGGGKRCDEPGCDKSSVSGGSGKCQGKRQCL